MYLLRNKKLLNRVVVMVLVLAMMFSATSCEKKSVSILRIDKESAINAMQNVLGLHEFDGTDFDHYYIEDDYMQVYCSSWDQHHDRIDLTLTENLRAIDRFDSNESYVHVTYFIFTSGSEANTYFHSNCIHIENLKAEGRATDIIFEYTEGECGYYIDCNKYDYTAMYYADDMVLTVTAGDLNYVGLAESYIQELGLPIE